MRKRILSILLTLCLAFALLPGAALAIEEPSLHVGGVLVTSENAGCITGPGITGTVSYDADSSILTLNSASVTGAYTDDCGNKFGIYAYDINLTIVLVGSNTIIGAYSRDGSSYGVYVADGRSEDSGNVTINGSGSLNAVGGAAGRRSYGVYGSRSVTINGAANVTATGGEAAGESGGSYGVYSESIVISGSANVTATGGKATGQYGVSCGVYSDNTVSITGGIVTAIGGEATGTGGSSYGVYGHSGSISVTGGVVNATGGVAGSASYGVYGSAINVNSESGSGLLIAKGGSATASNAANTVPTCGTGSAALAGVTEGTIGKFAVWGVTGTYTVLDSALDLSTWTDNADSSHWNEDTGGWKTETVESVNTLTLKNVIINAPDVSVSGSAAIIATGGAASGSSYGVFSYSSISVTGGSVTATGGSVTATGGAASDGESCGVYSYSGSGNSSISVTGGSVTATGGAAEEYSLGISGSGGSITLSGTVNAMGGTASDGVSYGVFNESGSISVTGGTTTAIRGTAGTTQAMSRAPGYTSARVTASLYADGSSPVESYDAESIDDYKYLKIEILYALTVNLNGGSGATVGGSYAAGTAVSIDAGTKPGYTFSGWTATGGGTFAGASSAATTYTMPGCAATITANWTANSTGSGGGGDDTPSRTITVTETSSPLFDGAQGAVRAQANMASAFSTSVEVRVTDSDEAASEFGLRAGNTVYPFDISLYIKGTNTKTEPKTGYAVTIFLPVPDDLLDVKERLSVAHKSGDGSVAPLTSQLKQINGVWYLVFEAMDFSPYALVVTGTGTYDETAGLPYYVDSDGNDVFIGFAANGKYIAPEGVTVLFKENAKTFTDIGSHWAKNSIGFVTERELFLGTTSDAFSPDSGMTRAMFATVVGRLYERSYGEIKAVSTHAFTDCDYEDYYGKYVDWAAENGILGGYRDGKFCPGDFVTREQMAAILYRFAEFLGVLPDDMDTELSYPDANSISGYAKNAALYCQTSGIITGHKGRSFAPQGTATRAEVAVILERFIETTLG